MKAKILSFLVCWLWGCSFLYAQVGGNSIYNFLDFAQSSRHAALGGDLVAVYDDDLSILLYNPSLIGLRHHTTLFCNVTDYFSNAAYGTVSYSHTFPKVGSFAFGMQFVNYGKFDMRDESGQEQGWFTAGDYAAQVAWGRQLDSNFTLGANLKLIYSAYESYHSFGLAVDVAASYLNRKKDIALTLLLRNMGSSLVNYVPSQFEKLPFDIQLAFSQKLQFLPVRYHISLHHLYRWDMCYRGENDPFLEYDVLSQKPIYPSKAAQFFDNFFRHINFGIEIIPAKFLSLHFSYNHHRHQEMKIPQRRTMAGFAYGFTIDIHAIKIGYSRAHYATGAVPNFFNLSLNFQKLSDLAQTRKNNKLQRIEKP